MQHVNVKIFAAPPAAVDLKDAIPVFHRWIQTNACPELLIDVVDYAHVPAGPGVLLMGHEAAYSLDNARGRLGLLYSRKAAQGDLEQAYAAALAACRRLEGEPEFAGELRFDGSEIEITLNDRLLYPNTEATWQAVRPETESFLDGLYGSGCYVVERAADPRERFRLNARRAA